MAASLAAQWFAVKKALDAVAGAEGPDAMQPQPAAPASEAEILKQKLATIECRAQISRFAPTTLEKSDHIWKRKSARNKLNLCCF